ncbi:wax ester/triacylglycerol synthase domain-containing protein [Actinophytocola sp.]|uniref:wax ester/triacylglycerol synthase domain-containing protein n=1 Tax=Actinophytocola sp. TaxID=1872138 RepID=UPI002ED1C64C
MTSVDRLTASDMSMLWPDDFGWPQDIGAVGVLDGAGLVDPDGRFRLELVRAAVEERLGRRFRQVVRVPRPGLGRPLWVDADRVDLEHHVRVIDAGGDLMRTVEILRRRPLDRARPLWEVWFLTGLPDGRVGCYVRAHHAIADGVAGVATLVELFGGERVAAGPACPEPPARVLLFDNLRRRWQALARTASHLARPRATLRAVRQTWPAVRDIGAGRTRMSFNRPLGPHRTLTVVCTSLVHVKEIAHAHDATVGDVVLAAIGGGLRDLLLARGEPVENLAPRAFVPVALRRERPGGNRTGAMFVPLPIGVADPARRLRLIAEETAVRRRMSHPAADALMPSAVLQRGFLRRMAHQSWANTYLANVPGPREPLRIAGAPVLALFPLVPLVGNVTLGVGALSYIDQFNLTVVADPDACPDVEVFVHGLRTTLRTCSSNMLGL